MTSREQVRRRKRDKAPRGRADSRAADVDDSSSDDAMARVRLAVACPGGDGGSEEGRVRPAPPPGAPSASGQPGDEPGSKPRHSHGRRSCHGRDQIHLPTAAPPDDQTVATAAGGASAADGADPVQALVATAARAAVAARAAARTVHLRYV